MTNSMTKKKLSEIYLNRYAERRRVNKSIKIDPISLKPVLFLIFSSGDAPISSGTGFIVNSGSRKLLFSARHCFTGYNHFTGSDISSRGRPERILMLMHVSNNMNVGVWREQKLYDELLNPKWFEHPAFGNIIDVAAIFIELGENDVVDPVVLESNRVEVWSGGVMVENYMGMNQSITDQIHVIGYPFSLNSAVGYPIWTSGYFASEPDYDLQFGVVLIDCRARAGQSGAPVYQRKIGAYESCNGEFLKISGRRAYSFVGLYSGRINKNSDIGIVWKSDLIKDIAESSQYGFYADRPTREKIGDVAHQFLKEAGENA